MLFNSLQTQNYLRCRTIVIFWESRAFLIVRIYGYYEFNVKLHLVMMVVHFYWDTIMLIESFDINGKKREIISNNQIQIYFELHSLLWLMQSLTLTFFLVWQWNLPLIILTSLISQKITINIKLTIDFDAILIVLLYYLHNSLTNCNDPGETWKRNSYSKKGEV